MWRASCDTCGWEQRADDYASAGDAARGHGDDCPDASTLVDRVAGGEVSECPKCRDWGKYETHEDHRYEHDNQGDPQ